jgi:hypothetical protein
MRKMPRQAKPGFALAARTGTVNTPPNPSFSMQKILLIGLAAVLANSEAKAEVVRLEIKQRLTFAEGRSFKGIGKYQRLLGRVHFAVDPRHSANRTVVDLGLAPVNAKGRVEFQADFEILAPVDLGKANGALVYDVNNRGNRKLLDFFNTGANHFLMRQGYIAVFSGWIAELLPGNDRLRLEVPMARQNGRPLVGTVRQELGTDAPATKLSVVRGGHGAYPPTERGFATATLTWRLREADARVVIPHGQWKLKVSPQKIPPGELATLPIVEVELPGGFKPGYIYELIYEAQGSLVQGLGLAGIRDLMTFLKHDTSARNPLRLANGKPAATRAHGWGISQSGRCLRQFLHDGFNIDERGRQVFDGLIPHVAGGGLGFFNHRFASPTRFNGQHAEHAYPCDVFPFTYGPETNPFTGRTAGILDRARADKVVPKIFHTQTSAEYWDRSGSLTHTDPLGRRDAVIPPEVRFYSIGGAQHGAGNDVPGQPGKGQNASNPTDYRPFLRALLTALDEWVREGKTPPPSVYPRITDKTLVGWRAKESGWRALPGVRYPEVIQQPDHRDYGLGFDRNRFITRHPPEPKSAFRVLVAAHSPDNNERGMLLPPTVAVPVATLTGWNLRAPKAGAANELLGLNGSYLHFAKTKKDRQANGDPRRSIEERYRDFDDYLKQFEAATRTLIKQRYLLAEDVPLLMERARKHKPLFE